MKKLFAYISGLFTYVFTAFPAFAAEPISVDPCAPTNPSNTNAIGQTLCDLGGSNLALTLRNIVVFFIILAVIIALLYLLYGGIKWITSRGEKTEVEAARNHIIAALIGLVVVFLAVFILSIVLAAFGIPFDQLKIPIITPK